MKKAYEEVCYRKRVQEFVRKYVSDKEKEKICIETLCFLHDKHECPTSKEIMDEISSKKDFLETKGDASFYISKVIWEFAVAVNKDRDVADENAWKESIRERIFKIAKSL